MSGHPCGPIFIGRKGITFMSPAASAGCWSRRRPAYCCTPAAGAAPRDSCATSARCLVVVSLWHALGGSADLEIGQGVSNGVDSIMEATIMKPILSSGNSIVKTAILGVALASRPGPCPRFPRSRSRSHLARQQPPPTGPLRRNSRSSPLLRTGTPPCRAATLPKRLSSSEDQLSISRRSDSPIVKPATCEVAGFLPFQARRRSVR